MHLDLNSIIPLSVIHSFLPSLNYPLKALVGTKASSRGDLIGVCIARHGTPHYVFGPEDLAMLQRWFRSGKEVMDQPKL